MQMIKRARASLLLPFWWGGEIGGGEEKKLQQETHRGGWYYVSQRNYCAILVAFIRHIKETRIWLDR